MSSWAAPACAGCLGNPEPPLSQSLPLLAMGRCRSGRAIYLLGLCQSCILLVIFPERLFTGCPFMGANNASLSGPSLCLLPVLCQAHPVSNLSPVVQKQCSCSLFFAHISSLSGVGWSLSATLWEPLWSMKEDRVRRSYELSHLSKIMSL